MFTFYHPLVDSSFLEIVAADLDGIESVPEPEFDEDSFDEFLCLDDLDKELAEIKASLESSM